MSYENITTKPRCWMCSHDLKSSSRIGLLCNHHLIEQYQQAKKKINSDEYKIAEVEFGLDRQIWYKGTVDEDIISFHLVRIMHDDLEAEINIRRRNLGHPFRIND